MEFTDAQLNKSVELWQNLIGAVEDLGRGDSRANGLTEEDIRALVLSDGGALYSDERTDLTLISCGDYHGSDLDSANNRALDGTPGVQVRYPNTGGMGSIESESTVVIGEMSGFGDDTATAIGWLGYLVDTMGSLLDYGLLDEEIHGEYIDHLADEAWSWMWSDVIREVDSMIVAVGLVDESGDEVDIDNCPLVDPSDPRDREDIIRDAYYSFEGNEWNAESATSVVNGRHDEAVRHAFETVFNTSGGSALVGDPNQLRLL